GVRGDHLRSGTGRAPGRRGRRAHHAAGHRRAAVRRRAERRRRAVRHRADAPRHPGRHRRHRRRCQRRHPGGRDPVCRRRAAGRPPRRVPSGRVSVNGDVVPDVLATRYASPAMAELWAPRTKVVLERRLWLAVLRAQRELGVEVPDGVLEAYEAVVEDVDLASIEARERVTRHDVKARIEEFSALAGHEHIHKGMTSRDLTENVEQLQVRSALELVRDRMVAALALLAERAVEHEDTALTGRTHNVPAQATTLGKRLASAGEELLAAFERVEELIARYPLRGLKGPVGTQQDQLDLLGGDEAALDRLEAAVAAHLGFTRTL